jgi:NitT/TauT family transport system substrate-binding protein
VAAIYQKSPYAIFSLKSGANVTDPKQLEGLEIGSGAGSFTPKVVEAFMKDRGLDPTKLKVTNVDGAARVSLLVTKKLPAIETFVMAQPSIERAAAPDEVKTFLLADHGLKLYSNGLVVRPDFAKANPELVKGFIKASLMGWRDAMRNPGEAGDIMMKYNKAVKREAVVEEIAIVGRLVATEETKAKGLGTIDPDTMKASVDLITKIVVSKNPVSFSNMYDTSFLPTPPVMP